MAKWIYRTGSRLQLFHIYTAKPLDEKWMTTDKYVGTVAAKALPDALAFVRQHFPHGTDFIALALASLAKTVTGEAVSSGVGALYANGVYLPDVLPPRWKRGDLKFPRLTHGHTTGERKAILA